VILSNRSLEKESTRLDKIIEELDEPRSLSLPAERAKHVSFASR
jgi:hypothetical protein